MRSLKRSLMRSLIESLIESPTQQYHSVKQFDCLMNFLVGLILHLRSPHQSRFIFLMLDPIMLRVALKSLYLALVTKPLH